MQRCEAAMHKLFHYKDKAVKTWEQPKKENSKYHVYKHEN